MNKPQFFESITEIEMRVDSAEQQIQSYTGAEHLFLKLSLIAIARGSCSMIILPGRPQPGHCGKLHIPSERNVIEAVITLPQEYFDRLIKRMARTADRAVLAKVDHPRAL